MKNSIGVKRCMKCGVLFSTDLRGGAKWCFPCKAAIYKEYQRNYKRKMGVAKVEAGVCS